VAFVAALIALRRRHPALREDRWLEGTPRDASGLLDVEWQRPDGQPMTEDDWSRADAHALVVALYSPFGADADRVVIACNAGHVAEPVVWPATRPGNEWRAALDTSKAQDHDPPSAIAPRAVVALVEERSARSSRPAGIGAAALDELATAAGIEPWWYDIAGTRHEVTPDTKRSLLAAMGLGVASTADARDRLRSLIAVQRATDVVPAPARAWLPESLAAGERRFGLAAQLYALRRPGDQGIGDFTTLALAGVATARAGGANGINPLRASSRSGEREEPVSPFRTDASSTRSTSIVGPDIERAAGLRCRATGVHRPAARSGRLPASGGQSSRKLNACFAAFEERSGTTRWSSSSSAFARPAAARSRASLVSRPSPLRILECRGSAGRPACGIRTMRKSAHSLRVTHERSALPPICSGLPIASSRVPPPPRAPRGSTSASIETWRLVRHQTAPRPGHSRRLSRQALRSARRPILSPPQDKTGACHHRFRTR
jgi:hypothetical protein